MLLKCWLFITFEICPQLVSCLQTHISAVWWFVISVNYYEYAVGRMTLITAVHEKSCTNLLDSSHISVSDWQSGIPARTRCWYLVKILLLSTLCMCICVCVCVFARVYVCVDSERERQRNHLQAQAPRSPWDMAFWPHQKRPLSLPAARPLVSSQLHCIARDSRQGRAENVWSVCHSFGIRPSWVFFFPSLTLVGLS